MHPWGRTARRLTAASLLAYGRMWDGEAERERGIGVTLHGPGGRRQYLLDDPGPAC